jgi:hypothetical protein
MKKLIATLSVLSVLTAFSGSAMAQEPATTQHTEKQEFKQLLAKLHELRVQGEALRVKLHDQTAANKLLMEQIRAEFLDEASVQKMKAFKEAHQDLFAQAAALKEEAKTLAEALQAAKESGDKEKAMELKGLLDGKKEELQTIQDKIETLKTDEDLQELFDKIKSERQELKALLEPVQTLWAEQKQMWEQVHKIQTEKKQQAEILKHAKENKNYELAEASLTEIVALKTRINALKQDILVNKQNVQTALQDILASLN